MLERDHPNVRGHKYMSDMVILYMQRVLHDLHAFPLGSQELEASVVALPDPMFEVEIMLSFMLLWLGRKA